MYQEPTENESRNSAIDRVVSNNIKFLEINLVKFCKTPIVKTAEHF